MPWAGLVSAVELLQLKAGQTLKEKWQQQALRDFLGAAQRRPPIMPVAAGYRLDEEYLLPFRDRYQDILTQAMSVVDFVYNTIEWAVHTDIDIKVVQETITRILNTGKLELEQGPGAHLWIVYSVWRNESDVGRILWELMAYYAR